MNDRTLLVCAVLVCVPFFSATAQTTSERIDRLERMIEGLQDQLITAREEMSKLNKKGEDGGKRVVKTDGKENITLSTTGGGLKLKSDNGNSFEFGGRILVDYDFFDDVFTSNGESQSKGEFRRTRLTASGSVKKDWKYKFTVNIDDQDETADVNTAYIEYAGFKPVSIRVGKFKEPFSLERLTSSKWISAIERSMLQDFLPGAGQPDFGGVQLSGYHKEMNNSNWAIGVFDDGAQDGDGEDNYAVTGRVAMSPHFADGSFLHLGAAYSVREIEGSMVYDSRFGVHTGNKVSFAKATVDDVVQLGFEAAYVRGSFSVQAEYTDVSADGDTVQVDSADCARDISNNNPSETVRRCDDIDFDGYYLQGSWVLTGEQRSYKSKGAYFDKVKPKGAMGAWELVARYENIEVEDDNDGKNKGAEKWILGVNWYLNKNVKFMLNYIDADVDKELFMDEKKSNDDGNAWSLRAQYAF